MRGVRACVRRRDALRRRTPYADPTRANLVHDSDLLSTVHLWNKDTRRLTMLAATSGRVMGPPGMVQGGCIFTLFDEAYIAYLAFTDGRPGLTKSLHVNYKKFTPVCGTYRVDVHLDGPGDGPLGRVVNMSAELTRFEWVGLVAHDTQDVVHADSTATFARPRETAPHSKASL